MQPQNNPFNNGQNIGAQPQPPIQPQYGQAQTGDGSVKTLGILSLVGAFVFTLVGLIIGIIGKSKIKKYRATYGTDPEGAGLVKAGFIVSLIFMIISAVITVIMVVVSATAVKGVLDAPSGTVCINGVCSSGSGSSSSSNDEYAGYVCRDGNIDWEMLYHSPSECAAEGGKWVYTGK
jgi:hypothetical protein